MKILFRFGQMLLLLAVCFTMNAQPTGDSAPCCVDCSCAFCGDIQSCYGFEVPGDCLNGPNCGFSAPVAQNGEVACIYWWENNTQGVGGTIRSNPSDPGDVPENCIPIDGGLGFLIAGGLGIGVVGIRRRKEEPLLKRA